MAFVGCEKDDEFAFTNQEQSVLDVLNGRFKTETEGSMYCYKFSPYSELTPKTVYVDGKEKEIKMYGTAHRDSYYRDDETEYHFDYVFELKTDKNQILFYANYGELLGYMYEETYRYEIVDNNTIKLSGGLLDLTYTYTRY